MHLVHNERVKLTAGWLQTAAGAALAIGILTPLAAWFYAASSRVRPATLLIGVLIWFVASVILHCFAQWVLGGLSDDEH